MLIVEIHPNENGTHPHGWDVPRQRPASSFRETVELEDIIIGDSGIDLEDVVGADWLRFRAVLNQRGNVFHDLERFQATSPHL